MSRGASGNAGDKPTSRRELEVQAMIQLERARVNTHRLLVKQYF